MSLGLSIAPFENGSGFCGQKPWMTPPAGRNVARAEATSSCTRRTLESILAACLTVRIRASKSCDADGLPRPSKKLASCSRASACFVANFIADTRLSSSSCDFLFPMSNDINDNRNSGGSNNTEFPVPALTCALSSGTSNLAELWN